MIQDVTTRWWSICRMLKWFSKLSAPIHAFIAPDQVKVANLTVEQKVIVTELEKFFFQWLHHNGS